MKRSYREKKGAHVDKVIVKVSGELHFKKTSKNAKKSIYNSSLLIFFFLFFLNIFLVSSEFT